MRTFLITAFFAISFFVFTGTAQAQSCIGEANGTAGTCQQPSNCAIANMDTSTACQDGFVCCVGGTQTSGTNTSGSQTTGFNSGSSITLTNPLGTGATLNSLLTSVLQFVVRIGSIVVIFMLIYVGYLFVIARGKEAEIRAARQALLWTIIGALVLLGAQAIAMGIQATVQALSTGG